MLKTSFIVLFAILISVNVHADRADIIIESLTGKNSEQLLNPDVKTYSSYYELVSLTMTQELALKISESLVGLTRSLDKAEAVFKDNKTFMQRLEVSKNAMILESKQQVKLALLLYAKTIRKQNPKTIEIFLKTQKLFFIKFIDFTNAILTRSNTAEPRAQELIEILDQLGRGNRFKVNAGLVQKYIETEQWEITAETYLNRQMISSASLSVLLVVEAVCIPFTGGTSGAAVPSTVLAIKGAATVAGRTIMIANSAWNIADRLSLNGVGGILNLETGIDVLMIMAMAPRPSLNAIQSSKFIKDFAVSQQQAGMLLAFGLPSYGVYQITFARRIVEDLTEKGVSVSEGDLRRQGYTNIALGVLSGLYTASSYSPYLKTEGLATRLKKSVNTLNPATGIKNVFAGAKSLRSGSLLAGAGQTLKGVVQSGYSLLFMNTLVFMGYTYPDFIFEANADPLPDLKAGETAVSMIGFDPTDILYISAHALETRREQVRKYGKNFYEYDFKSPDDFLRVLEEHARRFGRIRVLKIQAHGIPGKIVTRESLDKDGEFIDKDWMQKNATRIKAISKQIFAPDTKVRVMSCLVGGNLENEVSVLDNTVLLEKNSGDQFVNSFGENFLVNGGVLDTSRRVIFGAKLAFLPAITSFLNTGMHDLMQKPDFQKDLDYVLEQSEAPYWASDNTNIEQGESADSKDVAIAMAHRLFRTHTRIYEMIYKYGINLEGPWWEDRHHKATFKAH